MKTNFLPNPGDGITLEAFARAHDLPPDWLALRRACEQIVKQADFWYRPDLRQQAGDLALQASNLLESTVIKTIRGRLDRSDALSSAPAK